MLAIVEEIDPRDRRVACCHFVHLSWCGHPAGDELNT